MAETFRSGSLTLSGELVGLTASGPARPAVVVLHGYPSGPAGMVGATSSMPELAQRIAEGLEMVAFAPNLRGMCESEGEFSLMGWKDDIHAAVAHLRASGRVSGIWLAGFGTGGALAVCAGAENDEIKGVATLAAPADFDDWAARPRQLYEHARQVGILSSPATPDFMEGWARELRGVKSVDAAQLLGPRPLLVVHGAADDVVPDLDARVVADAHRDAELRIIDGAGHRLRHEPRAIAILLGWLDRQRSAAVPRVAGTDDQPW